eukprot:69797_1
MWIYELYELLNNMDQQRKHKLNEIYQQNETLTFTILSENIPITLLRNFMKIINNKNIGVQNIYGSTEAGCVAVSGWIPSIEHASNDLEERFYYFEMPSKFMKYLGLLDIEFNEDNEILVKSKYVQQSSFKYLGNPKKTAEAFDENGYF